MDIFFLTKIYQSANEVDYCHYRLEITMRNATFAMGNNDGENCASSHSFHWTQIKSV